MSISALLAAAGVEQQQQQRQQQQQHKDAWVEASRRLASLQSALIELRDEQQRAVIAASIRRAANRETEEALNARLSELLHHFTLVEQEHMKLQAVVRSASLTDALTIPLELQSQTVRVFPQLAAFLDVAADYQTLREWKARIISAGPGAATDASVRELSHMVGRLSVLYNEIEQLRQQAVAVAAAPAPRPPTAA